MAPIRGGGGEKMGEKKEKKKRKEEKKRRLHELSFQGISEDNIKINAQTGFNIAFSSIDSKQQSIEDAEGDLFSKSTSIVTCSHVTHRFPLVTRYGQWRSLSVHGVHIFT